MKRARNQPSIAPVEEAVSVIQRHYKVARRKQNMMHKSHVPVGLGRAVAQSDAEGRAAGRAGTPGRGL